MRQPFAELIRPRTWKPGALALLLSAWLALAGNLPFWRVVWTLPELSGWRGVVFSLGLALWIGAALMLLLSLLAWPRLFKPVAALLLVTAAVSSYFMLQYSVVIDTGMMANVVNTDTLEVHGLLAWPLLPGVVVLAGIPLLWLFPQRILRRTFWNQAWRNGVSALVSMLVLVLVTLVAYQDLASLMRNHKQVRYLINPLNVLYASGKLAADQLPRARQELQPIGLDARLGPTYTGQKRIPLVVLVVGETARAANFSLGGYTRQTNPQLEQIMNSAGPLPKANPELRSAEAALTSGGGLTYYSTVVSCGTSTQASLPCMFSHLGKQGYEASQQPYENLLDVLQRSGLAVLWVDNQAGCKGLCERVNQVLTRTLEVPGLCQDGECFDEVMLLDLDARIAALDPAQRSRGVVVVMHQMGSHGPAYYRRSPSAYKKFMPECASNVLRDCPREQVVNAYDNTLLYTDNMLASTVRWLDQRGREGNVDTAMVYVSDHGESLGENNLYLHGLPYALAPDTQTRVPMLSWLSGAMQQRIGVRVDCLRDNAATPLSHDNLFHAMLGLLDVQTSLYKKDLDWFARCR